MNRILRLTTAPHISVLRRYILSSSYADKNIWDQRLQHPAFTVSSFSDLGVQIMHKLDAGQLVSSVDYDVYLNKLHESDITTLEFVERLIKKYNTTQEALKRFPATSHALVRAYIGLGEEDRLMRLLTSRAQFGIFLDPVSAALLLDRFIRAKDWLSAAQVAYEEALQEESPGPLTTCLMLRACQRHWGSVRENGGWPERETAEEEDGEPEYVFVKYVRNPNYDDHFDVAEDRLLLGKTLVHVASHLSDPLLAASYSLLGLALYEKFDRLIDTARQLVDKKQAVAKDTVDQVLHLMDTATTLPEGETRQLGEVPRFMRSEIDAFKLQLQEFVPQLVSTSPEADLNSLTETFITEEVARVEPSETESASRLYADWIAVRQRSIDELTENMRRTSLLQDAKGKLRDLLDREELLEYVKQQKEVQYSAWLAPRTRREKSMTARREWKESIARMPTKGRRTWINLDKSE